MLLLACCLVGHVRVLPWSIPLDDISDRDGLAKLDGIARDPSPRAALGWFIGDDPQGVHTFRPVPAVTLWIEWLLWGHARWPYLAVNLIYLYLTALALLVVARRLGFTERFGWVGAAILLLRPTRGSIGVTAGIATRHDLLCTLFAMLAVVALLDWLRQGRRPAMAAYLAWSLLAYLSKEMALALIPLSAAIAWVECRRLALPRRLWVGVAASLGVGLVWLVWYRLAEQNMGHVPHQSHSLGGMIGMLFTRNPDMHLQAMTYNLGWWLADVLRQFKAVPITLLVFSQIFWKSLLRAVISVSCFVWLWRHRRYAVLLIYLWKLITYLPVMPLHDTWPWYEYMPHVLDPLLYAAAFWLAAEQLSQRRAARMSGEQT
ncbi:MAG: hypothetical protein HUU35_05500 [Armatimonadetes bacterium]|nr:hypothetical protein [Armatimonadota bacterium]